MAINPKIKQKAEDIRKKIFGAEVRESLASGIEAISEDVEATIGRQDYVEQQFQNVIDETTDKDVISAPELIAARNGKSNLKTRLDEEHAQVTAQLQHIAPDFTVLNGDGINDDSAIIANIISQSLSNGVRKIKFPKATYRMNERVNIYDSDLELDFSGSTIISYAVADSNIWGEDALFSVRGKLIGGDIIEWMRDNYTNEPPGTPRLLTYESVDKSNGTGKIKTSNNNHFSVGDDIYLRGLTRDMQEIDGSYDSSLFEPRIDTPAKVLAIDSEFIYVDYYSPFEYGNFTTDNGVYKSYVLKLNYLENFKLKNVHFIDKTTFNGDGSNPTGTEVSTSISMISPILCRNIQIENVSGEDHRMNLINPFFCRDITLTKLSAKNARIWSGGEGYVAQIRGSRDIIVDGIYGEKVRHTIDLSFSNNAKIMNVNHFENHLGVIDLHGICEHDVVFENVKGWVQLGNGIIYFPNIIKNLTFINSEIEFKTTSSNDFFVDNVFFEDCSIKTSTVFDYLNVTLINCNIDTTNVLSNKVINKRNLSMESSLIVKDVTLSFRKVSNSAETMFIRDHDVLDVDGLTITFADDFNVPTVGFEITLFNIKKANINRASGKDFFFRYRYLSDSDDTVLRVGKSDIEYTKEFVRYFVQIDEVRNSLLKILISENIVKYLGISAHAFFNLHVGDNSATDTKVIGTLNNNIFEGNAETLQRYFINDNQKPNTDIMDFGNVVISPETTSSSWNSEFNKLI